MSKQKQASKSKEVKKKHPGNTGKQGTTRVAGVRSLAKTQHMLHNHFKSTLLHEEKKTGEGYTIN